MSEASQIAPVSHFAKLIRTVTPERVADVARLRKILNTHGLDADPLHVEMAYQSWSIKATSKPWHPLGYRKDDDHYAVLMEYLNRSAQVIDLPPVEPNVELPPSVEHAPDDEPPAKQDDARSEPHETPATAPERPASDLSGVQGRRADGGGQGRRPDRRL